MVKRICEKCGNEIVVDGTFWVLQIETCQSKKRIFVEHRDRCVTQFLIHSHQIILNADTGMVFPIVTPHQNRIEHF